MTPDPSGASCETAEDVTAEDAVTCGDVRDLYPEIAGRVVLVCDRRPHKGGKHARHNADGHTTEQWWG